MPEQVANRQGQPGSGMPVRVDQHPGHVRGDRQPGRGPFDVRDGQPGGQPDSH